MNSYGEFQDKYYTNHKLYEQQIETCNEIVFVDYPIDKSVTELLCFCFASAIDFLSLWMLTYEHGRMSYEIELEHILGIS